MSRLGTIMVHISKLLNFLFFLGGGRFFLILGLFSIFLSRFFKVMMSKLEQ